MIGIELSYTDWKNEVSTKGLLAHSFIKTNARHIIAIDGVVYYYHILDQDNEADYISNFGAVENKKIGSYYSREPFASKTLKDGSKLYRRKHGYFINTIANSSVDKIITVPYAKCKINKIEIIDANTRDCIDLIVLDDTLGTYFGTANGLLNQFGFNVVVSDLLYSDKSDYDADLYIGMQLKIVYHNRTGTDKEVGLNVIFHEVV